MIRNVAILIANDLAIAFKNKTLYLVLFIPLFVFVVLQLVDGDRRDAQRIKIGLIEHAQYTPAFLQSLRSADRVFTISWFADQADAQRWLKEKDGDGVLIPSAGQADGFILIVLAKASFQTLAIVEGVSELQRMLEGKSKSWISEIRSLQEDGIQQQMLPTWILMLVLLVGFIVLPAQVAEEKEKKLLLGLLQTPISEVEWLLAKVVLGMILIAIAAALLQLMAGVDFDLVSGWSYFAFLMVGGFCFSAFGILVGFLCQTQASARTLGVLFYLPHLLPSALSDFSQELTRVAPLIPSYPFYEPVKSILLEGAGLFEFPVQWLALFGIGVFTLFLSHRLMKKRWLM